MRQINHSFSDLDKSIDRRITNLHPNSANAGRFSEKIENVEIRRFRRDKSLNFPEIYFPGYNLSSRFRGHSAAPRKAFSFEFSSKNDRTSSFCIVRTRRNSRFMIDVFRDGIWSGTGGGISGGPLGSGVV